jgi:hypothetical protein
MPLAPGPFLQVDQSALNLTADTYDFTDYTITQLAEIDVILPGWDQWLDDWGVLTADPIDPTGGIDPEDLLLGLSIDQGLLDFPSIDDVATAIALGDVALTAAVSFAPTSAWTDPTQPFNPPDTQPELATPTIPLTDFNPATVQGVGQSGSFPTPYVGLSNGTAVGSTSFTVGDVGVVYASGNPGDDVCFEASQYGVDLGSVTLGQIGPDGTFTWQGTFGPDEVGAWHEDFFVGGKFVVAFDFIVAPALTV